MLETIHADVSNMVFIHSGKYCGYTGIIVRRFEGVVFVKISGVGKVRIPTSSVAMYHYDRSNVKAAIDAVAFRCSQEILKHDGPVDVSYCVERFSNRVQEYLKQGQALVIQEGEREYFKRSKTSDPRHLQEVVLSVMHR